MGVPSSIRIPVLAFATGALCDCPRSYLNAAASIYLNSQATGQISSAFANTTFIENNQTVAITSSQLISRLNISHTKITIDSPACAAYVEVISTLPHPGHVIGTQIHTDQYGTPTKVDSVITTKGDWQFNATRSLEIVKAEKWDSIPTKNRTSRASLKAAIDAYLDLWGNPDADVPWGEPCRRMEGSAYTGTGSSDDTCEVGIPDEEGDLTVTNRRYVIDEQLGSANVLSDFGAINNGAPDSHEIRIEKGVLRFVHTMTVTRGHERVLAGRDERL